MYCRSQSVQMALLCCLLVGNVPWASNVLAQGKPAGSGLITRPDLQFQVDASLTNERISPLNGVNAGPGQLMSPLEGDVINQYRDMGIPLVRMHDYVDGIGDLSTIVLETDWSVDPADAANYDFAATDDVIQEIQAAGCHAMFRFGQSWSNCDQLNYVTPMKHDVVARVCSRIAAHYGGADSKTVKLWEIWNEPDLAGHPFWNHEHDPNLRHFFGLYATIARQLKQDHPGIVVGGPSGCGGSDDQVVAFARRFVQACKRLNAPLDFYSWHSYNRHLEGPYCYARQAKRLRTVLDKNGFRDTSLALTEWNSSSRDQGGQEWLDARYNIHGAAFAAAALTYLHQADVDVRHACRFRGDYHTGKTGYGLIFKDYHIKRPGFAMKAYSCLFQIGGAETFLLDSEGGNLKGRAILATTDSERAAINVLVSYWKCNTAATLTVRALPAEWQRCSVWHYLVSENDDWRQVSFQTLKSNNRRVTFEIPAPPGESCVHLFRVVGDASPQVVPSPGGRPDRRPGKPGIVRRPGRKPPIVRPRKPPNTQTAVGSTRETTPP